MKRRGSFLASEEAEALQTQATSDAQEVKACKAPSPDRIGREISRGTVAANQIARLHAMHTMPALDVRLSRSLHLCASFLVPTMIGRAAYCKAGLREVQPKYNCACFCNLQRRSQDSSACQMPQANSHVPAEPDAGPQHGCRPEGRASSRRALLAESGIIGCLAAAYSNPSIAAAAGVTPGQAAAALRAANVVPALPPSGYLRLIAVSRPTAERTVAAQVPILLCHT